MPSSFVEKRDLASSIGNEIQSNENIPRPPTIQSNENEIQSNDENIRHPPNVNSNENIRRPPPIDFSSTNFEDYVTKCPTVFGINDRSAKWLHRNIIEGDEMLICTLSELNYLYFNDSKVIKIADHCHTIYDGEDKDPITLANCSFYVTIATKKGYEKMLSKSKPINKSFSPDTICLKGGSTTRSNKFHYEKMFVDFFDQMFERDEVSELEKCYRRENLLTVSIFARSASRTKTNLIRYNDQLIGAASYIFDSLGSILLSWIGIIESNLSDLDIHDDFKDHNNPLRLTYNLGRFLLIICQVFKSIIYRKWCPIVCQVHCNPGNGPYNFYENNFFLQMNECFQLVYDQLVHRKTAVIFDDEQLVWMVLLFPLNDLLLNQIEKSSEWESYYLILIRGYYYFLNRHKEDKLITQKNVTASLKNICNNNNTFLEDGVTIKIQEDVNDDKLSLTKYLDENEKKKPLMLLAGEDVMEEFFSRQTNGNDRLHILDCISDTEFGDNNSLFMAISKLIYGSSHYYINLRLFICFYFRSVSRLSMNHPFYQNEYIPSMIINILIRIYVDKIPDNVYEPKSDNTVIQQSKYRKILYRFSQWFMSNENAAEYSDILILGSILQENFIVIEGRSYEFTLPEDYHERNWNFTFKQSNYGDSFIHSCMKPKNMNYRASKWIVCIYDCRFYPIIEDPSETYIDNNLFLTDKIGIIINKTDESDVVNINGDEEEQSNKNTTEQENKNDESLQQMLSFLHKEPFQVKKNIQKMFNIYVDSTTIIKYLRKGTTIEQEYGKRFSCADFQEAGVPDEYIMASARCLDPPHILVEKKIFPIQGYCLFTDLMTLRQNTCINESSTKVFVEYLSSLSDQYYFLDPATYNNSITKISKLLSLIESRGYEDSPKKDILLIFHIPDHYIVVEIRRSLVNNTDESNLQDSVHKQDDKLDDNKDTNMATKETKKPKIPIILACSLGSSLKYLIKEVVSCHLDLFLNILIGRDSYVYRLADSMTLQTNKTVNECGVICLQRLYQYAIFGDLLKELPPSLKPPMLFRCFILYKTLEFKRSIVSPYVMYQENYQQYLPENTPEAIQAFIQDILTTHEDKEVIPNNDIVEEKRVLPTDRSDKGNLTEENRIEEENYDSQISQHLLEAVLQETSSLRNLESSEVVIVSVDDTIQRHDNKTMQTNNVVEKSIQTNDMVENKEEGYSGILEVPDEASTSVSDVKNKQNHKKLKRKVESDNEQKSVATTRTQHEVDDDDDNNEDDDNSYASTETETDKKMPPNYGGRLIEQQIKRLRMERLVNDKLKLNSPTRSSARIKNQTSLLPILPKPQPTTSNKRNMKKTEPTNFATGFVVAKTPKNKMSAFEQSMVDKRQKQLEGINNRSKMHDEFKRCYDFDDSEDNENIVDMFIESPYFFIDEKLKKVEGVEPEKKHDPKVYLPKLYPPHQHNSKKAKEIVDNTIKPDYDKAVKEEKAATISFNKLSKKLGNKRNKQLEKAEEKMIKAIAKKQLLSWELNGQKIFLPYDSIYAIQRLPSTYLKNDYDYFAVTKNPDGKGYVKKLISKEWIDENFENAFLKKLEQLYKTCGWITFNDTLDEFRVITEEEITTKKLLDYQLPKLYEYKPLRGDDQILIIRNEVSFDSYAIFTRVLKVDWAILTLKESIAKNPKKIADLPVDPLERDKDGKRKYRSLYNPISKELLCTLLGTEFVHLLQMASVACGEQERKFPGLLCSEPKFEFAKDFDNTNFFFSTNSYIKTKSKITLDSSNKRLYDEMDLMRNGHHVMPHSCIGDFNHHQYYYYDMRNGFDTKYFVNVNSQQVSGIFYDEIQSKYYGIVHTPNSYKNIELEEEWVEQNFEESFLDLVKEKSREDQRKFVRVPIGKAKPTSSPPCNFANPKIQYLQNNQDTCVFSSIASAIYGMGFNELAFQISEFQKEFIKTQYDDDKYVRVMGILNRKIATFRCNQYNRMYQIRKIKYPPGFDLLSSGKLNPATLYHVVLRGIDGTANHCICVYNNFIFDGNYTHAWLLSQESLDECIDCEYVGIASGYMHILH
jgi:hypothetical protein